MSRWLVSQGDRQFSAQDLEELKALARKGELGSSDMVQPPGASEWLYAAEVPELQGLLSSSSSAHDDDDFMPQRSKMPLAVAFLAVIGGGAFAAWHYANQIPDASELDLLGDSGLELTELIITQESAPLYDKPDGSTVTNLQKDTTGQILGKRGEWYNIRHANGQEGYVKYDHVVPAYFFADKRTREDYDPLYNPDRYVFVKNSSWLQLDQNNRNLTIFQFMLQNKSKFDMTDVTLLATIKDKDGTELEMVEIPIEGPIPAHEFTMVGTLEPEKRVDEETGRPMTTKMFEEMSEDDEELQLRWSDGVEVEMSTQGFAEANIDILELRAVPKG